MTTPDQYLAEQIVAELIGKGLLLAERRESVRKKLSMGQVKAEDWRLLMAEMLRSKIAQGGAAP